MTNSRHRYSYILASLCFAGLLVAASKAQTPRLGLFEGQADIGSVAHPGSAAYDAATGTYTVQGNGENMWFSVDDFHFLWKKVSGDVALTANISFPDSGGNNHRKAVLMVRQSLDAQSPYIDVARHGDGLTSLQYRDAPGANTHEVESSISAPERVRIEKRGTRAYVFVQGPHGTLEPSGASIQVSLAGDYYVGIGVCSHEKERSETAVFRQVALESLPASTDKGTLYSTLETVNVASTDRRVTYVARAHFEAPNWQRDGASLLFNQDGHMWRIPYVAPEVRQLAPPVATEIPSGSAHRINNDHVLSPDGASLGISDGSQPDGKSRVSILPLAGGEPRQLTANAPSYLHGWSPDGTTLAFTGERGGEFDIYTIAADGRPGSAETRLTTAKGLDDGPEYTPDGRWIYFNSERTGLMQLWRMHTDGSGQEQVLQDGSNDWFPHLSPDGKLLAFVAYAPQVQGHPADEDVEIRLLSLADKKVSVLARLFGGQGTMNVSSWSPDSKRIAFVSYSYLH